MHGFVLLAVLPLTLPLIFAQYGNDPSYMSMNYGPQQQSYGSLNSNAASSFGAPSSYGYGSKSNYGSNPNSSYNSNSGNNQQIDSAGFGNPNQQNGIPYPEKTLGRGQTGGWPQSAYVPGSPSPMFPQPTMTAPPRPPPPPPPPNKQTAEARLAWLEYLTNVYIQCEDFGHARKLIEEMYVWLVRYPRLRREVSEAVQVLQQRIDANRECKCKGNRCSRNQQPRPPGGTKGDMTMAAERNLYKMMGRIHASSNIELDYKERETVEQVHRILGLGYTSNAMQAFQRLRSTNPTLVDTDTYGKLDFVLKMLRFDLENPDNCMPLWKSNCQTNWKHKGDILETYNLLRSTSPQQSNLRSVLYRIAPLPNREEILTRLLVAVGRNEAWQRTRNLSRADRYLAEACLTLHGSPRPGRFDDVATWEFHINPLDARAHAKQIYERCLQDRHLTSSAQCRDAFSQIGALERTCPFGGFVRIGTFSLIFGDYLFIKCLAPPMPPPSYFLPPRAPAVPRDRYRRRLRRLSRLLHNLTEHLQDVGEYAHTRRLPAHEHILSAIRDELN